MKARLLGIFYRQYLLDAEIGIKEVFGQFFNPLNLGSFAATDSHHSGA